MLAAIVGGNLVAVVLALTSRITWGIAISAAAGWLALVMAVIAAWDFAALTWGIPSLDAFDNWRVPATLRAWLPPAALLVGLTFGHFIW